MSAWELADLLGVHEHDVTMDALPNQLLHVVLELARRLDLHPAGLAPYAEVVYRDPVIITGRKATRGHPLSTAQKEANKLISRERAANEHGFADLWRTGGPSPRST
ncbi:hypothetical protein [Streptomyces sp. NPDC053427]|uniref:hypothetical protein n=1 Tax=Streptomyces sp. NPDC053427 TaxID=3365701 RepID=UPI0037CF64CC